jgi:hypothetical protein
MTCVNERKQNVKNEKYEKIIYKKTNKKGKLDRSLKFIFQAKKICNSKKKRVYD